MATEYLFSNNATTTLAQSVSSTATVLNVASGDGALFPSPASGQAFAVTLVDAATGLKNEICYCTSRSGDQLTVIRGQEGTNATAWQAGDTCANYITADVMESWLQESDLDGYATEAWSNEQFLQLTTPATQTVTGPVTFSGATLVPNVSNWGANQPIPALQADNRYVQFISDNVNWPVQYIGIGKSNSAPWFKSGPNYYFLQPAGDYALNSRVSAYFSAAPNSTNVTLTNLQGVNWTTSATNSYVQVTGNGISLAIPTVAYTSKQVSDEATLREAADTALQNQINTKQAAGNYIQNNNANSKFYCWNVMASSGDTINFPVEFTDVSSIVICLTSLDTSRGAWLTYDNVTTTSFTLHGRYMSHGNLDQMPDTQVSVMVYGW